MKPTGDAVLDSAAEQLEAAGYVVLRAKSYRAAQERQRVAQVRQECAEERTAGTEQWARDALAEQRRLADRLTFVWGIAVRHGATIQELRGDV